MRHYENNKKRALLPGGEIEGECKLGEENKKMLATGDDVPRIGDDVPRVGPGTSAGISAYDQTIQSIGGPRQPPGVPHFFESGPPGAPTLGGPVVRRGVNANDDKPIRFSYTPTPWTRDSTGEQPHHLQYVDGDLLFAARTKIKREPQTTIVELFKLNDILRRGWRNYCDFIERKLGDLGRKNTESFNSEEFYASPMLTSLGSVQETYDAFVAEHSTYYSVSFEDARSMVDTLTVRELAKEVCGKWSGSPSFNGEVDKYGGGMPSDAIFSELANDREPGFEYSSSEAEALQTTLDNYKMSGNDDNDYLKALERELAEAKWREAGCKLLHDICVKFSRYFVYANLSGILNMWNFLGVLNNTSEGKTTGNIPSGRLVNRNIPILNVITYKDAHVINRWTERLPQDTSLWILLKRRKITEISYGEYQAIPWSGRDCANPSYRDLCYRDISGALQVGHAWQIGRVKFAYNDTVPLQIRQMTWGINDTGTTEALEQKRTLSGTVHILVGVS